MVYFGAIWHTFFTLIFIKQQHLKAVYPEVVVVLVFRYKTQHTYTPVAVQGQWSG